MDPITQAALDKAKDDLLLSNPITGPYQAVSKAIAPLAKPWRENVTGPAMDAIGSKLSPENELMLRKAAASALGAGGDQVQQYQQGDRGQQGLRNLNNYMGPMGAATALTAMDFLPGQARDLAAMKATGMDSGPDLGKLAGRAVNRLAAGRLQGQGYTVIPERPSSSAGLDQVAPEMRGEVVDKYIAEQLAKKPVAPTSPLDQLRGSSVDSNEMPGDSVPLSSASDESTVGGPARIRPVPNVGKTPTTKH
jgi:hypothetical protein